MLARFRHRLLAGLAVVIGVVTLTFFLLHVAPGDPIDIILGPAATVQQRAAQRTALELDRPLPVQFASWLSRFARGDWGNSIAKGRPVRALLGTAWRQTAWLVGLSLLLSYLTGLAIGALQAARSGSRLDSDYLHGASWLIDRLRHLALPLATLTLIGIGGATRFVRGAMLETLSQPFITTARAKGVPPGRVVTHHALRNALTPVVTLLGLSLPALFSGAVFVEAVFAWPGVGRVLVEAVRARDYPVVMAATAISAVLVVAGNMIADVLAAWVDPRVRGAQDGSAPS